MITLMVITDGRRDCIERTIASARENLLCGSVTRCVIYDDSGELDNTRWLVEMFPDFEVIAHPQGRQGFGGAIRYMWDWLVDNDSNRYVFHLEDDFLFNRPVPLVHMAGALTFNREIVQFALRRQPWNDEERAAGGIVEQHPDDYTERLIWAEYTSPVVGYDPQLHRVLQHQRFFTTNPCLYRRSLCALGWPDGIHSEGEFGMMLRRHGAKFAFWGARDSGEWVEHIGVQRVGTGY